MSFHFVSSLLMTREQPIRKRDKLATQLSSANGVLRGSLLRRNLHHSSGCSKCARGEGHPLWVLNVGYPGGKTRQVSLRPEQVPQVRHALDRYHETKKPWRPSANSTSSCCAWTGMRRMRRSAKKRNGF